MKTQVDVVKRMFWLAWKACGGPKEYVLRDSGNTTTEEDVWKNVTTNGDYVGSRQLADGEFVGDYVFGRMMKLYVRLMAGEITYRLSTPMKDYQTWCVQYPTYKALHQAAMQSFE